MASSDMKLDSPAIRDLGPRFKLTESILWDDGYSSDSQRALSFPKHTKFKYDSDDDDIIDGNNDEVISNTCPETTDNILAENDDLTQQMSALGLPISFQTSKECRGKAKKKNKAMLPGNQESQKRFGSSTRIVQNDDESTACTTNSYCLLSEINLQMETEMSSRSYILEDDPKQHQEEVGINLPEQVYVAGSEISIVQPDDLGSSNTFEQTKVADCSKESQNMVVRDPDGNAECNCYQDENVKCNCRLWDWGAIWDSFYSRYYFYNEKTHESTWYPPPGMENFDFGDMSCISSESNAGLTGIDPDPDPATPRCEEEKVDGYELIERIGSDEPRADPMQVSLENTADDLSSAVFPDKICEVNASAIRAVDGNPQNEISSTTPSHTGDHTCFEDIEMTANDLSMQDGPPFVKQKKRKNRRSKTSHDNKNHELQPAEESVVDITKYWCQRYRLFSRFDHGVKMDEEGWFSVTPEAIARHQASRFGGGIIIDCFAGVGGNAIQFAKTGNHVVAFDIDPKKIEYAHHNASIYGVEDRIDFIIGDSLSLAPKMRADTVFLSPPWGGPGYVKVDSYDISMLQPYDGQFLFNAFKTMASVIIMFLPKNVNIDQLAKLALSAGCEWSLEVEKNYLNGKLKAITAYFYKTSEHKVD